MVKITPFDLQNVTLHYKWNNDKELAYYDSEYPHAHESFESFLKRIKSVVDAENKTAELFEIHLEEDNKLIGIVDLHAIDAYNNRCYVNCTIGDRNYVDEGHDVAAMKKILRYCFEDKKLHKVATTSFDFNTSWIDKVEQLGFKREGALREHVLKRGSYCDKYIYSLLAEEYEELHSREEALAEKG